MDAHIEVEGVEIVIRKRIDWDGEVPVSSIERAMRSGMCLKDAVMEAVKDAILTEERGMHDSDAAEIDIEDYGDITMNLS